MPVAVVTSRRIDFRSWDRASLGLPFGRGAMVLGEPIACAARCGRRRPRTRTPDRRGEARHGARTRLRPGRRPRSGRKAERRRQAISCSIGGSGGMSATALAALDPGLPDGHRHARACRPRAPVLAPAKRPRGAHAPRRAPGLSEPAAPARPSRLDPRRQRRRGALADPARGAPDAAWHVRPRHLGDPDLRSAGGAPPAARRFPPVRPLDVPRYIRRFLDHWQPAWPWWPNRKSGPTPWWSWSGGRSR